MRLWIIALLLAPFRAAAQDPSPEAVVAALQERAPRFRDLELRYAGRLSLPGEAEVRGETRLLLVPGTGLRTDVTVFPINSPHSETEGMEIDASTVELGGDLYFWGALHRGHPRVVEILPPCLSLKGSRKDQAATLDAFPADFPFRWVYEDAFALYALAPREAFARDPALRALGRKEVDGKDCHVLEVPVPREKMPADSLLKSLPIGAASKRYYVEAETRRLWRIELEFLPMRVQWEAKSWKEVAGIAVPAEVDIVMSEQRQNQVKREALAFRKVLSSAAADRGLAAGDLLPEERRKDVHVETVVRPVEFYSAAVERNPRDAAAWAGRALARYREAIGLLVEKGRETPLDLAGPISDFEKAQAIAPSSPFVNLSLLRLYEAAGKEAELSAMARALEGQPVVGPDLRLALARYWLKAADGERALRQLEGAEAPPGSPLGPRLARGRLRIAALALCGKPGEAGRALAELARGAGPGDTDLLMDVLAPMPIRPKGGGRDAEEDKGLPAALDAALEAEPRSAPLQEMRLRLASRAGDPERMRRALESCAEAVDDAAALDRAARLALDLVGKDDAPPEAVAACEAAGGKIVRKAPGSTNGSLLLGLALLKADKKDAALDRLESVLAGLEKQGIAAEEADRQGERLAVLSRAFAAAGRDEAVLRTCRLFVACVNQSRRPYLLLRGDANDPVSTCVGALLAKSRHVEAFALLKEVDSQKFAYLYNLRRVMRPFEEAFIRAAKEEVLGKSRDPEDFRKLAMLIQRTTSRAPEAVPLLEKALELAPGNVEILVEMASLCMGPGGDRDRAIRTYEELVAVLEKAPSPKADRDHSLFMIAHLHQLVGRLDRAVAALDRINLGAAAVTGSLLNIAAIYEQAGRAEKAIAAYRGYIERYGAQPHMIASGTYGRLGLLYEKADQIEEAYRAYSRGIEVLRREREQGRLPQAVPPRRPSRESTDPSVRREELLARVGRDYFIEKFLGKPFDPLTPDEERRVKDLYEKLKSDSISEREEADADLRKVGPRAAPLIKGGLGSTDPEFRGRVRQILSEWAEPR